LSKSARFAPGTDWSYSNTNHVLARLLIENTGRSYAEEMQRRILRPLGLSGKTLTASVTYVDDAALSKAGEYQKVVRMLTKVEFCGGQAAG
jgi:CubicO group peptidase (beta-lactamase class C family)